MKSSILAIEILSSNVSLENQLQRCIDFNLLSDKTCRLFAVWCYRDTLNWIKNPDPRSINAADVAERFAHGEATKEELETARSAAESAARSAESAWSAAWSVAESAWSAARSAARSAESAWSAAWSVAESAARSAAESATWSVRSAAEQRQREALIRLIKEELSCP